MAALIESGEIKQIIVVTGGRSNMGIGSIDAAKRAYDAGIAVSTIDIINSGGSSDQKDTEEVEEIAKAGGGLCEYSHIEDLSRTIQNLTHRTAQRTIEQIVRRQLKVIMGEEIESLEPRSRLKIVDFIEKYGDNINLKCIIVLDTSGSMRDKLYFAKKSVAELLESLQGRKGSSSIAVISYPEENPALCSIICGFTSDISILRQKLEQIRLGGDTTIGPAILKAIELMYQYYEVSGADISEEYEGLKYYE